MEVLNSQKIMMGICLYLYVYTNIFCMDIVVSKIFKIFVNLSLFIC